MKAELLLIFYVSVILLILSSVKEVLLSHVFIVCHAINSSLHPILSFCPCRFIRIIT